MTLPILKSMIIITTKTFPISIILSQLYLTTRLPYTRDLSFYSSATYPYSYNTLLAPQNHHYSRWYTHRLTSDFFYIYQNLVKESNIHPWRYLMPPILVRLNIFILIIKPFSLAESYRYATQQHHLPNLFLVLFLHPRSPSLSGFQSCSLILFTRHLTENNNHKTRELFYFLVFNI